MRSVAAMPRFLVEAYSPARATRAETKAARSAATELSRTGKPVRYLRTIFVPEDQTCFHVFEARSVQAVREVAERAGLSPDRIVEAFEEER